MGYSVATARCHRQRHDRPGSGSGSGSGMGRLDLVDWFGLWPIASDYFAQIYWDCVKFIILLEKSNQLRLCMGWVGCLSTDYRHDPTNRLSPIPKVILNQPLWIGDGCQPTFSVAIIIDRFFFNLDFKTHNSN